MATVFLLVLSNLFMTTAWYWHLRGGPQVAEARPLAMVIAASVGTTLTSRPQPVPQMLD